MLEKRFLQPPGFEMKVFVTPDGVSHRYGYIEPDGARGTIIVLHGFSEFIEKYFETVRDLTQAGYAVYTFDWRGQGKSDRWFADNFEQVYHEGFDRDAQNLEYFIRVVIGNKGRPLYAIAHSMGAHTALLTMKQWPGIFKAVSFSAPMVQFILPMPRFLAFWVLALVRLFRLEKHAVGKGGDWSYKKPPIEKDPRSHDPKRRLVHYQWCEQDRGLRLGNISFQWVYYALKSIAMTDRKGFLETIETPVLIGIAEEDSIVSNKAARRAASRLPHAELIELKGARHEILMERDIIRDEFLAKTLAFFDKNR